MPKFSLSLLFASLFLPGVLTISGCDARNDGTASTTPPPEAGGGTAPAAPAQLPSIPTDSLMVLFEQGTYLDATFYEMPVSINQSERAQIQNSLSYISQTPATQRSDCQPIGRIWFQIDGVNRQEADIYFSRDCSYYVWFENGKPTYSNELTQGGIDFYNNIIRSVYQNAQQQQQ